MTYRDAERRDAKFCVSIITTTTTTIVVTIAIIPMPQINLGHNSIIRGYKIGELAQKYWFEIPEHFLFVKLDEFVVLRNHIHGIIEIAKTNNDEWGNVT